MSIFTMHKTILLAFCLVLAGTWEATAQFIRVSMEVESELKSETVQSLQFGSLQQNSGAVEVAMGGGNMGIFSISGTPMQTVQVSIDSPEMLRHADRSLNDSIAIQIEAAYANRGVNRIEDAVQFNGRFAQFPMMRNTGGMTATELMRDVSAYIFIFGSITVGDIEPGLYDGEIVMRVEYL